MNLGVGSINWREGDEVVSVRQSARLQSAPQPEGPIRGEGQPERPVTPEKIEASLTPHTRMIALSHVDWTNGEVLPLGEICAAAREREVLTLIDGAQSVGNIPVDVPASGADMYAWATNGSRPRRDRRILRQVGPALDSPNVGIMSLPAPTDFDARGDYVLRSDARRFEASTMSPALAGGFCSRSRCRVGSRQRAIPGDPTARRPIDGPPLGTRRDVTIRSPRPAQSGLVHFEVPKAQAAEDAV